MADSTGPAGWKGHGILRRPEKSKKPKKKLRKRRPTDIEATLTISSPVKSTGSPILRRSIPPPSPPLEEAQTGTGTGTGTEKEKEKETGFDGTRDLANTKNFHFSRRLFGAAMQSDSSRYEPSASLEDTTLDMKRESAASDLVESMEYVPTWSVEHEPHSEGLGDLEMERERRREGKRMRRSRQRTPKKKSYLRGDPQLMERSAVVIQRCFRNYLKRRHQWVEFLRAKRKSMRDVGRFSLDSTLDPEYEEKIRAKEQKKKDDREHAKRLREIEEYRRKKESTTTSVSDLSSTMDNPVEDGRRSKEIVSIQSPSPMSMKRVTSKSSQQQQQHQRRSIVIPVADRLRLDGLKLLFNCAIIQNWWRNFLAKRRKAVPVKGGVEKEALLDGDDDVDNVDNVKEETASDLPTKSENDEDNGDDDGEHSPSLVTGQSNPRLVSLLEYLEGIEASVEDKSVDVDAIRRSKSEHQAPIKTPHSPILAAQSRIKSKNVSSKHGDHEEGRGKTKNPAQKSPLADWDVRDDDEGYGDDREESKTDSRFPVFERSAFQNAKERVTMLHEELKRKEENIRQLEDHLRTQKKMFDEIMQDKEEESKREIASIRNVLEKRLERTLLTTQQVIQEKEDLHKKLTELMEEAQKAEQKNKRDLETVKSQFQVEMKSRKDKWTAAEKRRREEWIAKKTKEIKDMTIRGLEPEIERLISTHKREVERLRQEKEAEIQELTSKMTSEKHEATADVMKDCERHYQTKFIDMASEFDKKLDDMREQYETQLKEQEAGLRQKMKEEQQKMDDQSKERVQDAVEECQRRHKREIADLEEAKNLELLQYKEHFEKKLRNEYEKKHDEVRDKLKRDQEEHISKVISKLEEESARIRIECDMEIRELNRAHVEEIAGFRDAEKDLMQEHRNLISEGEVKHKELLKFQTQSSVLERKISGLESRLSEFQSENKRLKEDISGKEEEFRSKELDIQHAHRKEVHQYVQKINEMESKVKELNAKHEREKSVLVKEKEEMTEMINARVRDIIGKKDRIIERLKRELEEANEKMREMMSF
eukprot:TRINITY_DN1162_c0_g1_i1.p1 TRINITY_DN1162_c0_g1~~TRINITY_DN1162_c0_g1_i1.p1  ORF type:complete len:1062 (+),score=416.92 TRINITY_DN1162_c0_g1_i1:50-3187(+)